MNKRQDREGWFIESNNKNKQSSSYPLAVEQFETANSSAISKSFIDSMSLLWPNSIQHECILIFVTDATSYIDQSWYFS
jgi:hypothetical protein